jgi:uncharacterized protein (DUF305 family)
MIIRLFLAASLALSVSTGAVLAQTKSDTKAGTAASDTKTETKSDTQTEPKSDAGASTKAEAEIKLPDACQQATQGASAASGQMPEPAQANAGDQSGGAMQGLMHAIDAMHAPMVQAVSAQDADVAFTCAMIVHHQGAIAMANVELDQGKDKEVKKMARKMIEEQTKEVKKMTKWVDEHAKK